MTAFPLPLSSSSQPYCVRTCSPSWECEESTICLRIDGRLVARYWDRSVFQDKNQHDDQNRFHRTSFALLWIILPETGSRVAVRPGTLLSAGEALRHSAPPRAGEWLLSPWECAWAARRRQSWLIQFHSRIELLGGGFMDILRTARDFHTAFLCITG